MGHPAGMENKDIYSNAPGEGMETKGTPGYVPAPLIRSDAPQRKDDDGDATVTANDDEQGTPPGADGEGKGETTKQAAAKKTTATTTAADKK